MREMDVTPEQARQFVKLWWLPVTLGVLSVVAGVLIIAKPDHSLKVLAVIAGIFILIDGLAELVMALSQGTGSRALVALLGCVNVVIGVLLIRHPMSGIQAIALLLGIWLIVAGVIRFVMAFDDPENRLGRFLIAGIEALFGIIIVSSAHIGFATLAILIGISFISNGFGLIAFGVLLRTARHSGGPRAGVIAIS